MNRTRYEPVPQRDEIIILDSIHSPNYNFNTGIPNSAPTSHAPSVVPSYHAPSIRSIPNSPPPSFHTHSSPGTPRPTPSTTASADYAELWGVAPSSVSQDAPTEICAASDALNTIKTLQRRVERLEESLGRLILEKETWQQNSVNGGAPNEGGNGNCCVTFTDASSDLERALAAGRGNCCVKFSSTKVDPQREAKRNAGIFILAALFLVLVMLLAREWVINNGMRGCQGKGCEVEFEST